MQESSQCLTYRLKFTSASEPNHQRAGAPSQDPLKLIIFILLKQSASGDMFGCGSIQIIIGDHYKCLTNIPKHIHKLHALRYTETYSADSDVPVVGRWTAASAATPSRGPARGGAAEQCPGSPASPSGSPGGAHAQSACSPSATPGSPRCRPRTRHRLRPSRPRPHRPPPGMMAPLACHPLRWWA